MHSTVSSVPGREMCEECHRRRCPSSCPGYREEVILRCSYCGEPIDDERALRFPDGKVICLDCCEGLDADGLVSLCREGSKAELILSLGAARIVGHEKTGEQMFRQMSTKEMKKWQGTNG